MMNVIQKHFTMKWFKGGRKMLVATLGSLAIICGTVGALGLCEKWLEHMGIFPEDYEDF